ncbi:MAG: nucleoside hydrolase [Parvularculaceae bacterium]|nr:nucleoside hydrolase [Parvularculaceae bacterium]
MRDVDDCLAVVMIARSREVEFAGMSSVFGNAPRRRVDRVLEELAALARAEGLDLPTPLSGAARAGDCRQTRATDAIRAASTREKLTILALGPLTNISCVLRAEPALASRIDRIVAVMGARAGHVFHPAENARGAPLKGHGFIVRDLNAQLDPDAVRRVLASGVPVTLVPYEAARQITLTPQDFAGQRSRSALDARLADNAAAWAGTWRRAFGRDGPYPFDAVAALALLDPDAVACRDSAARVEVDRAISGNRFGPKRLLVGDVAWSSAPGRMVRWCARVSPHAHKALLSALQRKDPS